MYSTQRKTQKFITLRAIQTHSVSVGVAGEYHGNGRVGQRDVKASSLRSGNSTVGAAGAPLYQERLLWIFGRSLRGSSPWHPTPLPGVGPIALTRPCPTAALLPPGLYEEARVCRGRLPGRWLLVVGVSALSRSRFVCRTWRPGGEARTVLSDRLAPRSLKAVWLL